MVFEQFTSQINFGFGGTADTIVLLLTVLFVFFVVMSIIGAGVFIYIRRRMFNKTIVIFEDVANRGLEPVARDRARLLKIGKEGEQVLYLMKHKVYRVAYGYKMGRNEYWFAIGDDGYWYNFELGELNRELNSVGVTPTSVNMRYAYTSIGQAIKDRYDKPSFWERYGNLIISFMFIAIIGVFAFLIFREFSTIMGGANQALESSAKVMEQAERVLGAIDNLQSSGGTGGAG